MHVLPVLRKLERKHAPYLVVVGVHSAKFPAEQLTSNVREAMLRYGVEHPVVNDQDFAIWQRYGVRAWPTLVFIDPQGKVIGKHEGEIPFELLDQFVSDLLQQYKAAGLLDDRILELHLERDKELPSPLRFPGKVLADAATGRLFIADSSHHRIVVTGLDGTVQQVIGSGEEGLRDGPAQTAQFRGPQGMALASDSLYVADTENHAIRRIGLADWSVETIAGTGQQAMRYEIGGAGRRTALNSPWDLALASNTLYIAMAGFHQIWAMDLTRGIVRLFAGTGHEGLEDGPRLQAWFAQPSGLSTEGQRLYVADSESSAIRLIELGEGGFVRTIVGQGLFEFGDVDGIGDAVRLQHPLGVCYYDGALYIADSYNNKIKRLLPQTRACTTLLGSGEPGYTDGTGSTARFREPGGLSVTGGKLYIADTNNHAIRIADVETHEVTTLHLHGLDI